MSLVYFDIVPQSDPQHYVDEEKPDELVLIGVYIIALMDEQVGPEVHEVVIGLRDVILELHQLHQLRLNLVRAVDVQVEHFLVASYVRLHSCRNPLSQHSSVHL